MICSYFYIVYFLWHYLDDKLCKYFSSSSKLSSSSTKEVLLVTLLAPTLVEAMGVDTVALLLLVVTLEVLVAFSLLNKCKSLRPNSFSRSSSACNSPLAMPVLIGVDGVFTVLTFALLVVLSVVETDFFALPISENLRLYLVQ